jgi:hypothetical protein
MPLTFAGNLDRDALRRACLVVAPLVSAPEVSEAWDRESALPGMTVGGVTRHLVSQPGSAVEFLPIKPAPQHAPVVTLAALYERTDWFAASVSAEENTSIRDGFNAMAVGGASDSVAILEQALAELPEALATAGETTYVPWQDATLATDDFIVVRLMEVVVHADDLAVSVGLPTPEFDDDVLHPALALLAMLGARRHGQDAAVRALSRAERATRPAAAF